MSVGLKYGFLKKSFNYELTANPPKSDDWKWSTDKGACIIIKCLLNKSILSYSHT